MKRFPRIRLATAALALLLIVAGAFLWQLDSPQSYRGHLTLATAAWTFASCDTAPVRRVQDMTAGRLGEIMARFMPSEEPIYVEVRARRLPFSRLAVSEILYAARETRGCRDNLHEIIVRGLGNEPFWAVTITRAEIRFETPDEPGRVVFPVVAPVREDGRLVYRTRNDRGDRLQIAFREQACSDGMSDAYYNLTTDMEINARAYSGCGRRGWTARQP